MFVGEVYPTSMTRRPGSACSRLRSVAQPLELRGIRGPVSPELWAGAPLPCFFSNHDLNNLPIPSGAADPVIAAPCAFDQDAPPSGEGLVPSGLVFAPWVKSTLPRNTALSSMASRSARTSPS